MSIWCCFAWIAWVCIGCTPIEKKTMPLRQNLRLSFQYDPMTVDPRKNSDPVSCSLMTMLYEGLTSLESDGSVSLALAESVEISKNATKYTFRLKDALWSNGEPITAYDFEYSWKTLLSPQFNSVNAYFLYPIVNAKAAKMGLSPLDDIGVYAEDVKTLTVRLEQPNTCFLKMLAFTTCFPISQQVENNPTMAERLPFHTVFNGPFVLEEWHHNNVLILKKNPFFWNAAQVRLEQIEISIISDEHTAWQLYQTGELDVIGGAASPIPHSLLATSSPSSNFYTVDYAGTTMCFFNIHCFPFTNMNIRKAFSYAIEKESIVKHLCQGNELQAYGLIPPMLKAGRQVKFIPNGSTALARHHFELGLKETGLSRATFPSLTFSVYSNSLQKTLALALQQQWNATLGIHVGLETVEIKVFLDKLYKKNYQFALMSVLAQYFDPMNFLERFVSPTGAKNYCAWENSEFTHLVSIAPETASEEERLHLLERAEAVLMSEAPIAPIYHHTLVYAKQNHVEGLKTSPIGRLDFSYTYLKDPLHHEKN